MNLKKINFFLSAALCVSLLAVSAFATDDDEYEEEEEEVVTTQAAKSAKSAPAQKQKVKKEKVNAFVNAVKAKSSDLENKQDLIEED